MREFKDRRYERAIARWLERELDLERGTITDVQGVEYYPETPGYGTYTPGDPAYWSLYYTRAGDETAFNRMFETCDEEVIIRMITEACEFLD
jgi:hypothetical protein